MNFTNTNPSQSRFAMITAAKALLNDAFVLFRENPSADNYARLERCMLIYQDYVKNHNE